MIRPLALSLAALAVAPHAAAQAQTLNYTCNIEGASAKLTAQVEAISDTGIVYYGRDITGVIGTGQYKLRYSGQLVSQTARYVFTGEDGFADFTDMGSNARFHVQMVLQGQQLMLVVNPETQSPVRYMCQQDQ